MKRQCQVCVSANLEGNDGGYVQCPACQSYVYLSGRSAEADNKHFYDELYHGAPVHRKSRVKSFIFRTLQKKDRKLNADAYRKHQDMRAEILSTLRKSGLSGEIGFGEGRMLESLLKEGVDIIGVDLSENVVNLFGRKHPEYRDRVKVGSRFDRRVNTIYCSALLEHLDNPAAFIQDALAGLEKGGRIIIDNLPILNPADSNIAVEDDINFWKPCHRIIYSFRGLQGLFERSGFCIERYGLMDLFNYRVLSLHVQKGYSEIVTVRSSCLSSRGLPGPVRFLSLCRGALKAGSRALAGSFIFKKV